MAGARLCTSRRHIGLGPLLLVLLASALRAGSCPYRRHPSRLPHGPDARSGILYGCLGHGWAWASWHSLCIRTASNGGCKAAPFLLPACLSQPKHRTERACFVLCASIHSAVSRWMAPSPHFHSFFIVHCTRQSAGHVRALHPDPEHGSFTHSCLNVASSSVMSNFD
ncbi:hypothetical protein B0H13DRAFT_54099 [Mycena leptocephala]|nr:hypothetical protein B0H13DRAFT_54099 [Mycena leptocephala]